MTTHVFPSLSPRRALRTLCTTTPIAALWAASLLLACDAGTEGSVEADAVAASDTGAGAGAVDVANVDTQATEPDAAGGADVGGTGQGDVAEPDTTASEDGLVAADGGAGAGDTAVEPDVAAPVLPDYTDTGCYGQAEMTQLFDHARMAFVPVDTTCRAEGELTQVFVADDLWAHHQVTQEDVNAFMHRYEIFGPEGSLDPGTGALFVDEEVFGALRTETFPDGKLRIFILDTDGYGDAYVCPTSYGWCPYYCLHLDGVQMDIKEDYAISVAAHETFHIIHHFFDGNEESWLDETLAEAAMLVNGYYTDSGWVSDWLLHTDYNWGPGNEDHGTQHYGAFLLLGAYLWESGGPALLEAITAEPGNGFAGLDAALKATGDTRDGWQVFLDFAVSMGVEDVELGYGFGFAELPPAKVAALVSRGGEWADGVQPYGIDYLRLKGDGDFAVTVTSDVALTVLGVVRGEDVAVTDLSAGGALHVPTGAEGLLVVTARALATYTIGLE